MADHHSEDPPAILPQLSQAIAKRKQESFIGVGHGRLDAELDSIFREVITPQSPAPL